MTINTFLAPTTAGNAYVSTGVSVVSFLQITNFSGNTVTANVFVVPSGATANVQTNMILDSLSIASKNSYQLYTGNEKIILANGDAIQVAANVANSLNVVTSFTSM